MKKKKKMLRREEEYLKNCSTKGKWIIAALSNRLNTLEKVTKAIINHQKKFFIDENNPLLPLNLKNIAKKTDLHESTISRATTNKFIETPRGIFELKYFFSTGIECGPNSAIISNKLVKERILSLIKKEDKNKRISDERVVFKLKTSGIKIARRTVSKYRKRQERERKDIKEGTDNWYKNERAFNRAPVMSASYTNPAARGATGKEFANERLKAKRKKNSKGRAKTESLNGMMELVGIKKKKKKSSQPRMCELMPAI